MFARLFPGFPSAGVVVLVGISGSGKSSWAAQALPRARRLSSDELRGVLTDDEDHQDCSQDAFAVLETLAGLRLKYGRVAVIDATNLKRSARLAWLKLARQRHVPAVVVWFDADPALCARRQRLRQRLVPAEVIARQARALEMLPQNLAEEGWDGVVRLRTEAERPGEWDFVVEALVPWLPPAIRPEDGGAGVRVQRRALDIIGDVHGCYGELVALLQKLGYAEDREGVWRHAQGRFLIFVGDLTDRGPDSRGVLGLVARAVRAGAALLVQGNHDDKLRRWLRGNDVKAAHGLETTIAEFSALSPPDMERERAQALALLEAAPLWALCDPDPEARGAIPERVVIAHAAWKPSLMGGTRDRVRSFCLYGPTTGTLVNGMPQRLDWKRRYPADAPLCVVGHTPFVGPVVEERNTLCLDTACVFGGRLSALRWPEREVVEVAALQTWAQHPNLEARPVLIDPDAVDQARAAVAKEDPMQPPWAVETIGPDADFALRLDRLLARLDSDPEPLLRAIEADEKLLRRSPPGSPLTLSNASKLLFTPEATHQLYAKGLVYQKDPWRAVSVPYLKMYNYGERRDTTELANALAAAEGVQMRFSEKLDGTMIQSFSTAGLGHGEAQVLLTTRGMIEGLEVELDKIGFDYLGAARALLAAQTPALLDPAAHAGLTLLWELIHPEARIVTDYGDRRELVLTGAIDARDGAPRYLARPDLEALAATLGAPLARERHLPGDTLAQKIEALAQQLEGSDEEGAVITFEGPGDDGRLCVLHRVKVKSPAYLRLMRLFAYCTYDRTREFLEANPELTTWELFKAFLLTQGSQEVPEEVLGGYRAHFEAWQGYRGVCRALAREAQAHFQVWTDAHGLPTREAEPDAYKSWRRALAAWVGGRYQSLSWLVFAAADGRLGDELLHGKYRGDGAAVREALASLEAIPKGPPPPGVSTPGTSPTS
jgi:predicted kinase